VKKASCHNKAVRGSFRYVETIKWTVMMLFRYGRRRRNISLSFSNARYHISVSVSSEALGRERLLMRDDVKKIMTARM
jgi:hypothetical protein